VVIINTGRLRTALAFPSYVRLGLLLISGSSAVRGLVFTAHYWPSFLGEKNIVVREDRRLIINSESSTPTARQVNTRRKICKRPYF
jgi:hypothetical protein